MTDSWLNILQENMTMDSLNAVYREMLQKWIKSLSGAMYFPPRP